MSTSTSPTVRGLEARRASLAPGAYLAIVHVSPGGQLGPIGRGGVLPEVLDHVHAIEAELAESRAGAELGCDAYRDEVDSLREALDASRVILASARATPAHTQAFIDAVREALGVEMSGSTPAVRHGQRITLVGAALDLLDIELRGAR